MEHLVKQFIYVQCHRHWSSMTSLHLDTGSTPAAVIAILQTVTNLLSSHPYVIVISLDFSKASETVRHATLLQKFAQLDILDAVYN